MMQTLLSVLMILIIEFLSAYPLQINIHRKIYSAGLINRPLQSLHISSIINGIRQTHVRASTDETNALPKKTPVTIISGISSTSKTFAKQIISSENSKKYGFIVDDVSSVNFDPNSIQNTMNQDSENSVNTIEFNNGCVCCGKDKEKDFMVSFARLLSISDLENHRYDNIIIESCYMIEPRKIRELFQEADDFDSPLLKTIQLDTFITVLDAKLFYDVFGSIDELGSIPSLSKRYELPVEISERTVTDIMLEQIECADVILIDNVDSSSSVDIPLINDIINILNPSAKVVDNTKIEINDILQLLNYGKGGGVASMGIMDENRQFLDILENKETQDSITQSSSGADCGCGDPHHKHSYQHNHPLSLDSYGSGRLTKNSYNIEVLIYKKRKPFHPLRLSQFLRELSTLSITRIEQLNGNLIKVQSKVETQRISTGLIRSRGIAWVASSKSIAYGWSHAGQYVEITELGRWNADINQREWPEGMEEQIQQEFSGDEGDRRQELIFIGQFHDTKGISKKSFEEMLDSCLVTDEEMLLYKKLSQRGNQALRNAFISSPTQSDYDEYVNQIKKSRM